MPLVIGAIVTAGTVPTITWRARTLRSCSTTSFHSSAKCAGLPDVYAPFVGDVVVAGPAPDDVELRHRLEGIVRAQDHDQGLDPVPASALVGALLAQHLRGLERGERAVPRPRADSST